MAMIKLVIQVMMSLNMGKVIAQAKVTPVQLTNMVEQTVEGTATKQGIKQIKFANKKGTKLPNVNWIAGVDCETGWSQNNDRNNNNDNEELLEHATSQPTNWPQQRFFSTLHCTVRTTSTRTKLMTCQMKTMLQKKKNNRPIQPNQKRQHNNNNNNGNNSKMITPTVRHCLMKRLIKNLLNTVETISVGHSDATISC